MSTRPSAHRPEPDAGERADHSADHSVDQSAAVRAVLPADPAVVGQGRSIGRTVRPQPSLGRATHREQGRVPNRVLVIGAHPARGHALQRLTRLTAAAWRQAGAEVELATAPGPLSRRMRRSREGGVLLATEGLAAAESAAWLARLLRRLPEGIDLVQVIDVGDLPYLSSLAGRIPVSVLCHDVTALAEFAPGAAGRSGHPMRRLRARAVLRGLERADRLVATSRHTADAIEELTGRRPEVLHPPVDPALTERSPRAVRTEAPPAWPYLLVVGGPGDRSRRSAAIAAWTQLRRTPHLDGVSLVVVGSPLDDDEEAQVTACGGHVSVLTDIPDAQLGALYARSRGVLALDSPHGFVWPIAEAHQAGRPVLATDHEVFQETGGAGCVYLPVEGIDRFDAATWCSIAEDLTAPLVADRAGVNAGRFAWHRFVEQLPVKAVPEAVESFRELGASISASISASSSGPVDAEGQPISISAALAAALPTSRPSALPAPRAASLDEGTPTAYGRVLAGANPAGSMFMPPPETAVPTQR